MMRLVGDQLQVYLYRAPIDMRRGRNGLAAMVKEAMKQDPFAQGSVFAFIGRKYDAMKILTWDRNGFEIPCDNTYIERQIKHYATGRRAWLFCYDKVGAQASANLYSLVMTCRINGVEPFGYLHYLFDHLPAADTVEKIEALLPWKVTAEQLAEHKRQQDELLKSAEKSKAA